MRKILDGYNKILNTVTKVLGTLAGVLLFVPAFMHRDENGDLLEPFEALTVDVPQEYMGAVMEDLGLRKAELQSMTEMSGYLRMEFIIPARGLIGFRNQLLTDTKGNGIMNHGHQGSAT